MPNVKAIVIVSALVLSVGQRTGKRVPPPYVALPHPPFSIVAKAFHAVPPPYETLTALMLSLSTLITNAVSPNVDVTLNVTFWLIVVAPPEGGDVPRGIDAGLERKKYSKGL